MALFNYTINWAGVSLADALTILANVKSTIVLDDGAVPPALAPFITQGAPVVPPTPPIGGPTGIMPAATPYNPAMLSDPPTPQIPPAPAPPPDPFPPFVPPAPTPVPPAVPGPPLPPP